MTSFGKLTFLDHIKMPSCFYSLKHKNNSVKFDYINSVIPRSSSFDLRVVFDKKLSFTAQIHVKSALTILLFVRTLVFRTDLFY